MNVRVFKAQRAVTPIPDLLITATETIPWPSGYSLDEARIMYDQQAQMIVSARLASLPGGTIDAILVKLLDHKRSLLRIRGQEPASAS